MCVYECGRFPYLFITSIYKTNALWQSTFTGLYVFAVLPFEDHHDALSASVPVWTAKSGGDDTRPFRGVQHTREYGC